MLLYYCYQKNPPKYWLSLFCALNLYRRPSLLPGEWQCGHFIDCVWPERKHAVQIQSSSSDHTGLWPGARGNHHHRVSRWRFVTFYDPVKIQSNLSVFCDLVFEEMVDGEACLLKPVFWSSSGSMSQYSSQSVTKREVFNLPTEITSHTMFSEPFVSSGINTHSTSPWVFLSNSEVLFQWSS